MKKDEFFDAKSFDFDFDSYGRDAANSYEDLHNAHLEERTGIVKSSEIDSARISFGRLQLLIQSGRQMMSGKFSKFELVTLCEAFECNIFTHDQILNIEKELRSRVRNPDKSELLEKVKKLSVLEKFALADFVEQMWTWGWNGDDIDCLLTVRGLDLASAN